MSTTTLTRRPAAANVNATSLDQAVTVLSRALSELRFGAVQLTVHEGRIVQMDITERHRF